MSLFYIYLDRYIYLFINSSSTTSSILGGEQERGQSDMGLKANSRHRMITSCHWNQTGDLPAVMLEH